MKKFISLFIVLFLATAAAAEEFMFALSNVFADMDQTVNAGESIAPIVFDYQGITDWEVSELPSDLMIENDVNAHTIMITGTISDNVADGDYEYTVTVKDKDSKEHSLSGTIKVIGLKDRASISVVSNEKQKVTAGDAIKPITFSFANISVTEDLENFLFGETVQPFPATLTKSVENNILTVSGTVNENTKNGTYTIKVIAKGERTNDTAFATVEVVHKPIVTSISVVKNATQTATAGDSIKPIVFKYENIVKIEEINDFPGGYDVLPDIENKTLTVIGKLNDGSKGPYTITFTVNGADNDASAEFTINATPSKLKFELADGSDDQTVVAGKAITPIVYKYDHMFSAKGSGFPADLKVENDQETKQVKIYGTVNANATTKEYVYTFALTDLYGNASTVTGKINVVRESGNSSVASSSSNSAEQSSSSVKPNDPKSASGTAETSPGSSANSGKGSSNEKSENSDKTDKITTVAMNSVKFGYTNNTLTVALPTSSMVRVQVFDLTGHLVESYTEPVTGSRNYSLAHLNRGSYLVRVESNNQTHTAKIAVK